MLRTYLRNLFLFAAVAAVGGPVVAGAACSPAPRKSVPGTTGTAGTGSTTTGTSTGTSGTTGTAGVTTTGSGTGTAGTTGTAGDTSTGAAGSTTGTAGSTAGTTGTGGDPGAAGAAGTGGGAGDTSTGTAGTNPPPVDNSKVLTTFPVTVTDWWYPSGWAGDDATVAAFTSTPAPITITDQSNATTGPCSKRVTGHVGSCFKITYTPVASDAGATHASVALIPNIPNSASPNFGDSTMAPHVPQGATRISAEVAGSVGGEVVQFNLWGTDSGDLFTPTFPAGAGAQTWQKIMLPLTGVTYDQELSPFGWGSASTTPITFYYDDIRIENTP
jgi:hypothetical protein